MNDLIIVGDGSVPAVDAPLYKTLTLSEAIEIAPGITIPAGTKLTGRLDYLFPALDNNPTPNNKANMLADITAALYGLSGAAATVNNALANVHNAMFAMGTYTGNGAATRTISLNFTPRAVLVLRQNGYLNGVSNGIPHGGLAVTGSPAGVTDTVNLAVSIVTNGFTVYTDRSNISGTVYNYIALR